MRLFKLKSMKQTSVFEALAQAALSLAAAA